MSSTISIPLIEIINNNTSFQQITESSNTDEITVAVSNYIRATSELELLQPAYVNGQLLNSSLSSDIAKKYDYIESDEKTGLLGILSNSVIAEQNELLVEVDNGVIRFITSFGVLEKKYTEYTDGKINSAIDLTKTTISVRNPVLTSIPVMANNFIITAPEQLIAQTALTAGNILLSQENNTIIPPPPTDRLIVQQNINNNIQRATTKPKLKNFIQQSIDNDSRNMDIMFDTAAVNPALYTSYQEDASSQGMQGISNARNQEQVNSSIYGDVASTGLTTPTVVRADNPTTSLSSTPTTNAASSSQNVNTSGVSSASSNNGAQVATTSQVSSGSAAAGNTQSSTIPTTAQPNPLHAYKNYTYKFTMYALPASQINKIAEGGIEPGGEETLVSGATKILSSGGFQRSSGGTEGDGVSGGAADMPVDYFIDNVKLESIVGVGAQNRGTDVIAIDFEIIEPYNVTFLPRLLDIAQKLTTVADWGKLFFVLVIDFYGYGDDDTPVKIDKTTRYIPFKMINMTFEVNERGSVYKVKAVPAHHKSYTALDNNVPFSIEFRGGSLNDWFNGNIDTAGSDDPDAFVDQTMGSGADPAVIKGLAQALNNYQNQLVEKKQQKFPHKYKFEFQGELANAKIYTPNEIWKPNSVAMSDSKKEQVPNAIKIDKNTASFKSLQGTRITDLITQALQVSSFYRDQYSEAATLDTQLKLHKIVPKVKFLQYDQQTGDYQREITYVVFPYKGGKNDAPNFGQKAPTASSKEYNWIFTGKNKDVINAKVEYKMSFYDLVNAAKKEQAEAEGNSRSGNEGQSSTQRAFGTRVQNVRGIQNRTNSVAVDSDIKTLAVQELFARQFDNAGDLIALDLTIVGDPNLIQQDDLIYSLKTTPPENMIYNQTGVLNFLNFEQYFRFIFKSPVNDYNENTGLFGTANETQNAFNGLYRILSVKSEFRQGRFTQQLKNYRVRNQTNVASTSSTNQAGGDTTGTQAESSSNNVANVINQAANVSEAADVNIDVNIT